MTSADSAPGPSHETLRGLEAVTDAALSQLGLEDLLAELLDRTRDLLSADTAAILLLDPTGTELVPTAASGLEREARLSFRVRVGEGFAGRVAAEAEPVVIEHVDGTNVVNPILLAKKVRSVLGVPMFQRGRVIGVLHVGTLAARQFSREDVELLRAVSDRASLATQARLSRLERAAAVALQHSLLPARPRAIPGLDVAARYVPGAEVGVGGDWYDVFALPSGYTGVVIGDVAGHGLHAAVVMGRIRSALRAYALETDDPAEVLTRLDRKVQLFEPGAMATVLYAVIDPTRTGLTISSAGHLPPIVLAPNQPSQAVKVDTDLPLGAYDDVVRHNTTARLDTGACVFLYTDGLIERRDRFLSDGIDLLLSVLTCTTADNMCATAMSVLLDNAAIDDIAILAVRNVPE
jgi:serine phosphatase RsbU (regulator of sigma subunit)